MSEGRVWVHEWKFTPGQAHYRDEVEGGSIVRKPTGDYDAGSIVLKMATATRDPKEVPPAEIVEAVRAFFAEVEEAAAENRVVLCPACETPYPYGWEHRCEEGKLLYVRRPRDPNALHAALDAYIDEPTGLSGREMLEEVLWAAGANEMEYLGAEDRAVSPEEARSALRRLLNTEGE